MHHQAQPDCETYQLIVTRRGGTEVLIEFAEAGWHLPRLEVESRRRIAKQLTAGTKVACGLDTYCLFVLRSVAAPENTLASKYMVMEAIPESATAAANMRWVPSEAMTGEGILSREACAAVRGALEEIEHYVAEPLTGPFGRPGWIRELFWWARDVARPFGLRLPGSFTQFNASPTFSLIRIRTSGPTLWFKAAGEPNAQEMPFTATLARLLPRYLPEVLGIHERWNGWLSCEAPGATLDNLTGISSWARAAKALAELQIASMEKSAVLVESGLPELGAPQLIEQVDRYLARMSELMALQTKQPPARLTDSELELLGADLKKACAALRDVGLPDTLGHLDFNPGNILVSEDRCIFLDWAEACVAHPFLTFEFLREHATRQHTGNTRAVETITDSYLGPWRAFFSPGDLARGLSMSPLVAVFAYAAGSHAWYQIDRVPNPAVAGYFRSLTRRMHHEAARIRERSEACPA